MNAGAIIFAGMPPPGLGVYCRDAVLGAPFRWRAINGTRGDARAQIAEAKRRGWGVWIWAGPAAWAPDAWRASLARFVALANETGAAGVIIDAENGWPDLARAARESELSAFGYEVSRAGVRMGFTSYPSFPGLEVFARAAGIGVWGSPQLYFDPATNAAGWARWKNAFGALRVIPSIPAYVSGPRTTPDVAAMRGTREAYAAYLASMPRASGAIAFPGGAIPAHIQEGLTAYSPGGSQIGTVAIAAATFRRKARRVGGASRASGNGRADCVGG